MKKSIKIVLVIIACVLSIIISLITYYLSVTINVKLDQDKLVNLNRTVSFYDDKGRFLTEEFAGILVTDVGKIPDHVNKAFIAIEDKRFYKHKGVDVKGVFRAMLNNIASFSFKEGASTISQQLIKNTHLSNEKTIKRKLSEIKLAKALEKKYSKDEILCMYLNTIYFGDNCYGITSASEYYFGKKVCELDLNDAAILAAIIKAPSYYSPIHNEDKCYNRKNLVLKKMHEQGFINSEQFNENVKKPVQICQIDNRSGGKDYLHLVKNHFNGIIGLKPYFKGNLKVYTTINRELQDKILSDFLEFNGDYEKSVVIIDKDGKIRAYYSTCGDVYRQMGSVIKPLIVYAPAIENEVVYPCTPILDEKTDFNGYSPSNYGEKYNGYISVKEALASSSNVCAVKILNSLGVNKALNYAKKMDIPFTDADNSLCLALGASEKGAKLTQIVGAYSIFNNYGTFKKPSCIEKITDSNGNVLYTNQNKTQKIFDKSTCSLINDMTEYTAKEGTAKKLSFSNIFLSAKTGTVGNEKGNTDAYCISYNSEYVLGVWFGNKENSLMSNDVTGGGLPTVYSAEIWKNIYRDKLPPSPLNNKLDVKELRIDKISYDEEHKIVLAEDIAPERYVMHELFRDNTRILDLSKRFSNPKINKPKLSINTKGIEIELCLTEYLNAEVFREENGKKIKVYDTKDNNKNLFIDSNVKNNGEYRYCIVPYFNNGDVIYKGNEVYSDKIKTPNLEFGEDWWVDDF